MTFSSTPGHGSKLDRDAGRGIRARRGAGAGRRAHRRSRPDAADGQPRCDRPHGAGDHARRGRAREPAAVICSGPLSEIVLLSDLWSPIDRGEANAVGQLSATGAHGHVVQIVDPAEETFPYSGRVEFIEPEGAGAITAGRAETWRADYEARVARHRAEIRAEDRRTCLELRGPPHRPAGERTAAGAA